MYTKVQTMHSNIITPTPMGAVVSVIVVVILLYLFVGELSSYTKVAVDVRTAKSYPARTDFPLKFAVPMSLY